MLVYEGSYSIVSPAEFAVDASQAAVETANGATLITQKLLEEARNP